jgi:hypothetical protein
VSTSAKLAAISHKSVTKQWLTAKKVALLHPQVKSYSELALRHRFLRGFCRAARDRLHTNLTMEMGRQGLASKPYPLSRAVLMDGGILTSAAFAAAKEKEEVPTWRDGQAGEALQLKMVDAAVRRYFEFGCKAVSDKAASLWSTGSTWAGFSRLAFHVDALLEAELGHRSSWPDCAACVHREMWTGEHDTELARLAAQLPGNLDNTPNILQKHLKAGEG